ncbi:MAG TPA: type III pantothenate kinase [Bacteriovoracaceae bacterium]|nr:type III pantothenate kinase [Bacteriovoracaceae bacterium]
MHGLITLDFGNTNPHAAIFKKTEGSWRLLKAVPWVELPLFLSQYQLDAGNSSMILAEVKNRDPELQPYLEKGFLVTRVKDYWKGARFAGMPVNYAKTLGEDRLIEAFYCYKNTVGPTLLINAGTFVTVDVISSEGFLGGYIIPGMKSYFSSYQNAELLKDVQLGKNFKPGLPATTAEAMTDSYTAFAALAKKLIDDFAISKVLISGGDSKNWEILLQDEKLTPVVETNPHLIHSALLYWMTTQIEPL